MDHLIELLELLHGLVNDGLSWATGVALVLGILKIAEGRRKRLEQREVNRKLDALGAHMGVPDWNGASKTARNGQTSLKPLWKLSLAGIRRGYQLRRSKRMNTAALRKILIIPILSFIAGYIKDRTGYELPNEYLDQSADILLYVVIPAIATLMHPHKKGTIDDAISNTLERSE